MMGRLLALSFAILSSTTAFSQTVAEKTVPVQRGQEIELHFDYPELIRVSTWDKNEVHVRANVSINDGENNDAFTLHTSAARNSVSVHNTIEGLDQLPKRVTVTDRGQKITFRSQSEFREYQREQGNRHFERVSTGVDMDIVVDVKVPRNSATRLVSVYGVVEVKDFTGPLVVDATYGAVDASLAERAVGQVNAETNFGDIYTNFDSKFTGGKERSDFDVVLTATPGAGPSYRFVSKYGNVYVRKGG